MPRVYPSVQSLLVASLALETALAVSLYDFTPRVSNLPSACASVYMSQISGCQPSDFQSGGCSQACIAAFNSLQSAVSSACQEVTGQNVLVAFMAGQGTEDLCPNAANNPLKSTAAGASQTSDAATTTTSAPKTPVSATSPSISTTSSTLTTSYGILSPLTQTPSSVTSSQAVASSSSSMRSTRSLSDVTIISTATVMPSPGAGTMTASETVPSTLLYATSAAPTTADPLGVSSTVSDVPAQATSGGEGSPFDTYSVRKSSAVRLSQTSLWAVIVPLMISLTQIV